MTTSVQLTPTQTAAASYLLHTANYPRVVIHGAGLGESGSILVEIIAPNGEYISCVDVNGDAGMIVGDPGARTFVGGPTYVVSKSATDDPSAAYFIPSVHP